MEPQQNNEFYIKRPDIPEGSHPIKQGDYILDTIAIKDLSEEVLKWIHMRNSGAIIYGAPRLGKTFAIEYLKRVFDMKYKTEFATFLIKSEKVKISNEDRFFTKLLYEVGHSLYKVGKAHAKKERLINYLLEKGEQSTRNQIVWFYDDAQRLGEYEYEWLMDIYNELQSFGITLTILLTGQEELKHRRNLYLSTSKQIVGRFMIYEKQFYGMKKIDELAFLLEGYDSVSEYPENSGCSYTKFFFPEAFIAGYRLEKEASLIWNIIQSLRMELGLKKKMELPMRDVIAIINYVLIKFGDTEQSTYWPNEHIWREGVMESGYLQGEVIQSSNK
ncbi:ATP-binding protein [Bacillus canaveralius]|uniref:ATP-binding protein n=1 Tax=Bacillus canaveralius TaxID=1403243 RepID=UPI000F7665B4|nr:ATP-binding protein [Bacillus canaveralius]RSK49682.1 ATP-binding protein [Bacillus canaveralius]